MVDQYLIFLPTEEGSVEKELRQCLYQIRDIRMPGKKFVKLNIFVDLPDFPTLKRRKKEIGKSLVNIFHDGCPAYNVVVQPPEKPWKVAIEALSITSDSHQIINKIWKSIPYVVVESDYSKEVWAAGLGNGLYPRNTSKASVAAFDQMVGILETENMSLNHVVRQWNYVGNILSVEKGFQNYQLFNEVRSEYYERYRSKKGYPAATGVGIKHEGFILDFHAVKSIKNITILPVDNPDQINAYNYNQKVLKGLASEGKSGKKPPMFERALLMTSGNDAILYISGTAAIIGQETIGINNVKLQTRATIENITKLKDNDRLCYMLGCRELSSIDIVSLRAYIKNQEDFSVVKAVCEEHFSSVPSIFVEADICRDDLLVEIEAEFKIKIR